MLYCRDVLAAGLVVLYFLSACNTNAQEVASKVETVTDFLQQPLLVSGENDTHTYRIPAIVTSTNGDLIAACDARRNSGADLMDHRTIDIVFRRSTDNGQKWTPIELLENRDDGGCSDPSLLVDRMTGDVFCFYNFMSTDKSDKEFRFVVHRSRDHGATWSEPIDFTDQVAGNDLKDSFKFVTSGRGIQTRDGALMHNYVRVGKGITVFKSTNHGETWNSIADVQPADESKLVQLPDDSLMINSRKEVGKRFEHRSEDGGKSWTTAPFGPVDPRCNASILAMTAVRDGFSKDRLLFCNAASAEGRKNLTLRISYDSGRTWSHSKVIDDGPSAYSEMTILRDGSIGILYEPGYDEVRFVRLTLQQLTGGADGLQKPYSGFEKTETTPPTKGNAKSNFSKGNLVAWCIVPFDAKKRGPAARAKMVSDLGIKRVAYDWRKEHVVTFEEEILAYRKHDIEFFAFWSWRDSMEWLIKKHGIHPQIWITAPSPTAETQQERIEMAAAKLLPLVEKTRSLGLKLGLYNHGGWGGMPDNLVAMCEHLQQVHNADHVGIVYNFHHAHDQVDSFSNGLMKMKPHLLCLNLNGMVSPDEFDVKQQQNKIRPGSGKYERDMIMDVVLSGYLGPVGILDHRNDLDSEVALTQNLQGTQYLLSPKDEAVEKPNE